MSSQHNKLKSVLVLYISVCQLTPQLSLIGAHTNCLMREHVMSFSCRQNNWHSLERNSSLMWQINSQFCKVVCFLCFHLSSICFLLMLCFIMLDYFRFQSAKSWGKVPLDSGLTNGEYIAPIIFLLIGLLPHLLKL